MHDNEIERVLGRVITNAEVARRAGVTSESVRLWVHAGKLHLYKITPTFGVFDVAEVDEFLARRAGGAK